LQPLAKVATRFAIENDMNTQTLLLPPASLCPLPPSALSSLPLTTKN
jgi:hypothetical protein